MPINLNQHTQQPRKENIEKPNLPINSNQCTQQPRKENIEKKFGPGR